ncbi:MAG: putative 4-hydroxybenzoate polyprenyltransferase [Planctomycetota bacterium]|nr:putative 4-hydroxybenzoate polyprenyltransferase [Planctomycetota bacterium]
MWKRLLLLLDSIKFAHSVFALPFALLAMVVAAQGWPSWRVFGLILLCMVSARSAAMAFNRWADRELDAANPRTQARPTVTGALRSRVLLVLAGVCSAVFCAAAWLLNPACFACALPVLAILLGYSLSKRFTNLCHFWLGLALGLAPVGAHLAVRGDLAPLPGNPGTCSLLNVSPDSLGFELFPVLIGLGVLFWASGFDLIYACQDYEVDRADPRLRSLPKSIGIRNTLLVSAGLHLLSVALLIAAGVYAGLGVWYWLAAGTVSVLLVYEHWIVRPDDLSRVNVAFFTVNGVVSLLLFAAVFVERVLRVP